jgi:hypothetical protein
MRGVLKLKADIESIKPNVIVALGSHPLRAISGKSSIDKWRGSIIPATLTKRDGGLPYKTVNTYHPAYCLRVYDYKAVSEIDLSRVRSESSDPEIRLPRRDYYLHPSKDIREQLVSEMARAEWLAVDIECWLDSVSGKWRLACVGFSDQASRSLTIHNDGPDAISAIRQLCACPAKKVFQNGTFDVTVLREEGIEVTSFSWDTMLAHHSLYPECASGADEMSAQAGKKRSAAIKKG